MARPRKPLDSQIGHLTQETQIIRSYEESLIVTRRDDLQKIPLKLFRDKAARREYKRILPQILDNAIVGDLDRNNLVVYCNAWSEYQELMTELKNESHFVLDERGALVENPKYKSERDAYKQMITAGEKLGMSIASRLNAAALKAKRESDRLQEDFGDI